MIIDGAGSTPALLLRSADSGPIIDIANFGSGRSLVFRHYSGDRAIEVNHSNTDPSDVTVNLTNNSGGGTHNSHVLTVNLTGTGNANVAALNVVSANEANSAMWLTGHETNRGTLKIAHVGKGDGSDANASAISIDLQTAGTASQGIFMDATDGATTGNLLEIRNGGGSANRLRLTAAGNLIIKAPNAAPASTSPPMFNGSIQFWLDEAGNNLKVIARYSGGTVKTATVALV
ncbi:MAG: hypothetical protein LC118_07970 [Dehalococcoidia bacterium]|nr:hypothetical protein [Dehalococcoidia bacterium]